MVSGVTDPMVLRSRKDEVGIRDVIPICKSLVKDTAYCNVTFFARYHCDCDIRLLKINIFGIIIAFRYFSQ